MRGLFRALQVTNQIVDFDRIICHGDNLQAGAVKLVEGLPGNAEIVRQICIIIG